MFGAIDPFNTGKKVSPAPNQPWIPSEALPQVPPPTAAQTLPGELNKPLSLAQLTEIALSLNVRTRQAWMQARVEAAQSGIDHAGDFPQITGLISDRIARPISATSGFPNTTLIDQRGNSATLAQGGRPYSVFRNLRPDRELELRAVRFRQAGGRQRSHRVPAARRKPCAKPRSAGCGVPGRAGVLPRARFRATGARDARIAQEFPDRARCGAAAAGFRPRHGRRRLSLGDAGRSGATGSEPQRRRTLQSARVARYDRRTAGQLSAATATHTRSDPGDRNYPIDGRSAQGSEGKPSRSGCRRGARTRRAGDGPGRRAGRDCRPCSLFRNMRARSTPMR